MGIVLSLDSNIDKTLTFKNILDRILRLQIFKKINKSKIKKFFWTDFETIEVRIYLVAW